MKINGKQTVGIVYSDSMSIFFLMTTVDLFYSCEWAE